MTIPQHLLTTTMADYHNNLRVIDELIDDLQELSSLFTTAHKRRLQSVVGNVSTEVLTVDEVTKQYELVKKVRDQIVDNNCELLDGVEPRVIAALISSINSLISLYLKNEEKIDHIKKAYDMYQAVVFAISEQDKETQTRFFAKLDELSLKSDRG